MKYLKHSKRQTALKSLLVGCCIVAVFAAGVLLGQRITPQNAVLRQPEENVSVETKIPVAPEENTAVPAPVVDDGNFALDTPYCELRYPMKWTNYVDFDIQDQGEEFVVGFYGIASESRYHLFDVCFGTGEGYQVGSFATDNGEVAVSVIAYDIPADAAVTDEERLELNAMCEDMNVVLANLMEQPGFAR